jgi:hypothetical protein
VGAFGDAVEGRPEGRGLIKGRQGALTAAREGDIDAFSPLEDIFHMVEMFTGIGAAADELEEALGIRPTCGVECEDGGSHILNREIGRRKLEGFLRVAGGLGKMIVE